MEQELWFVTRYKRKVFTDHLARPEWIDEAVEDGLLGAATGFGSGAACRWVGSHIGSAA